MESMVLLAVQTLGTGQRSKGDRKLLFPKMLVRPGKILFPFLRSTVSNKYREGRKLAIVPPPHTQRANHIRGSNIHRQLFEAAKITAEEHQVSFAAYPQFPKMQQNLV